MHFPVALNRKPLGDLHLMLNVNRKLLDILQNMPSKRNKNARKPMTSISKKKSLFVCLIREIMRVSSTLKFVCH